ncbi:MAG: hypothetical protein HHAS10_03960 [Candidatus Altimarinota bacterium]
MKKIIALIFLILYGSQEVFASLEIILLFPNPTGDDVLGEYIEIHNISCIGFDISSYSLSDASGKTYFIPTGTFIEGHTTRRYSYNETKISLNNNGIETVYLKNFSGEIIDLYTYSGTQKDDIVLEIPYQDEACEAGNTGTGVITGTGIISSSGSIENLTGSESESNNFFSGSETIGTFTGEITVFSGNTNQSGVIQISTGEYMENQNILTNSGIDEIIIFSGVNLHFTGSISAEWLYYDDEDSNGFIDRLYITYEETLTGAFNTGSIALSSSSGGISQEKIDTETGYLLGGFLSGNTLILKLKEGNIPKKNLKINNTTTSELRLKSLLDLGFYSINGHSISPLYLTSSFMSYKNTGPKKTGEEQIQIETGGTNTSVVTEGSLSGSDGSNLTVFPKIFPTIQSPTNAVYQSGIFLCTEIDCRINITFVPIFSGSLKVGEYDCYFGTGENLLIQDDDCNPNTYSFHESGSILFELLHIKSQSKIQERFTIDFDKQLLIDSKSNAAILTQDTGKPIAIIEIDGKWKEYYEQIGDHELNCYTFTCGINFTAEKSYDPEGNPIRFLWIYGRNDIKTSKDPGAHKYGIGDHRIILRVIDESENYDEILYIIHVLGPRQNTIPENAIKASIKKSQKKISAQKSKAKKKYKKIHMEFFSLPTLFLQGKTGKRISEANFQCSTKTTKTCSLNFSLSGTLSSMEYRWYIDGKEVYKGKNPKVWKFSPGNHSLTIETYRKGSLIASSKQIFDIKVIATAKKVKKSAKKAKAKKTKDVKIKIIPTTHASNDDSIEGQNSSILALFILLSGLGFGFLLRGRKRKNHSS